MSRLIFHIDVNSAFLSWESVRRVKTGAARFARYSRLYWRKS